MRLLHARNHDFKEFLGSNIPEYAIISHRWSDDELSHQDFLGGKREGYGWTKISEACEIALQRNLKWIWVDTICIDKKSSAELSEAINSMYCWYRDSTECYVLLPDVFDTTECHCPDHGTAAAAKVPKPRSETCMYRFSRSDWFNRGWTLQELLAPPNVIFFNARYRWIGSKSDLSNVIGAVTGIPIKHISDPTKIRHASIAERMKWASQRQTTRKEDIAYSLLGLFDVSLPLLYGEGSKAFLRLQSEIIKKSDDESIFVWWTPDERWTGLLAPNPGAFYANHVEESVFEYRRHFEMTNKGLRFSVYIPDSYTPLSGSPRANTRMILPLNVVQVTSKRNKAERPSVRRAALKFIAHPNRTDYIIQARRFIGGTREVGMIFARENFRNSHGIEHIYDEDDSMRDFGEEIHPRDGIPVGVLKKVQGPGKEWQIYFAQDGM